MIKFGHAVVTALALGVLLSQPASAQIFCETEVPRSSTNGTVNGNGTKNFQNITMCFDEDESATANVVKGSHIGTAPFPTSNYQLTVNMLGGQDEADLFIVDSWLGNIITGCEAIDTNPSSASVVTTNTCAVSQSAQAFIYLHVN